MPRSLRPRGERQRWFKLVLGPKVVPKRSFISWLVMLNRLSTKDGLRCWGIDVEPSCIFCGNAEESMDHLLFMRSNSKKLWHSILKLCGLKRDAKNLTYEQNWAIGKI